METIRVICQKAEVWLRSSGAAHTLPVRTQPPQVPLKHPDPRPSGRQKFSQQKFTDKPKHELQRILHASHNLRDAKSFFPSIETQGLARPSMQLPR